MMRIELTVLEAEQLELMLEDAIIKLREEIVFTKDCGLTVVPHMYEKLDMYKELAIYIESQIAIQKHDEVI